MAIREFTSIALNPIVAAFMAYGVVVVDGYHANPDAFNLNCSARWQDSQSQLSSSFGNPLSGHTLGIGIHGLLLVHGFL